MSATTVSPSSDDEDKNPIEIVVPITVAAFGEATDVKPFLFIRDLMEIDVFVNQMATISESEVRYLVERHRLAVRIVSRPDA